jgi:hypothetical protein
MVKETASDARRRLHSRPWDHDFVIMRGIAAAFSSRATLATMAKRQ